MKAIQMLYGFKKRENTKKNNLSTKSLLEKVATGPATSTLTSRSTTTAVSTKAILTLTTKLTTASFPPKSTPAGLSFQTITKKSPNMHICLDGKFDAISILSDNYTYVFKGRYLYKIG